MLVLSCGALPFINKNILPVMMGGRTYPKAFPVRDWERENQTIKHFTTKLETFICHLLYPHKNLHLITVLT
jgi:hypothetical protein